MRPELEVADILRAAGPAFRHQERGHLSLGQLKVMSAIEQCRSAVLGGHVLRCTACQQPQIAYNSCRNRHCPKRQGDRWVSCRPGFFLSVRVLSRLFRRLFLEALLRAHRDGQLLFFGEHAGLADPAAFARWLAPLRKIEWGVYAKRPFAGPKAVLAYLSRYTHRVAIANSRLIAFDERGVTFHWKDYRNKGRTRYKTMTLATAEFMRRFLLHVLPSGFHRIRHYGLLANAGRKDPLAVARQLLQAPAPTPAEPQQATTGSPPPTFVCRHCGAPMIGIETFAAKFHIRAPPRPLRAP